MIDTGAPSIYHVSSDESKFGVPISEKESILEAIEQFPVTQLHVHAGSHMTNLESSISAVQKLVELAEEANQRLANKELNHRILTLDIGGGLPPEKLDSKATSNMQLYAENLLRQIPELTNYQLITEFGQWCYFYTGYALSQIEYVLKRGEKNVVFIHLGADYLMRDAYSKPRGLIFQTYSSEGAEKNSEIQEFDVAGPLCFAGDYLAKNQPLCKPEEGDWLALVNTGSNSLGLWSRHCSRSIPKVFAVDFNLRSIKLISERQSF
jgi:diaminopimelate decarboxylase